MGGVAATGITVDVPFPTGFVNGGTAITSAGTSYEAFFHTWTVPTLAAGQTVTMTLPCFPLVSTPVKLFAQVTANAVLDVDSQPNNNATTTPVEDDEAAATVTTGGAPVPFAQQNAAQFVPIVIQQIYPSVTEGDLTIVFNSIVEREVTFEFYDFQGIRRRSETLNVERGKQVAHFDVWDLPQGAYIIQVSSNRLRNVPMKFVKL